MMKMKLSIYSMVAACALSASAWAAESQPNLQDSKEKISYALGVNFGTGLRTQGIEVNLDTVLKGIQDGIGNSSKLKDDELRAVFNDLRSQMTARAAEKGKKNKEEGEKFLAENAKKEGVKTTASGLQYKVIKEGEGESPKSTDEVSVTYTGKLIDGTVFDSSEKHGGKPANFKVGQVIRGWTEALQLMKKGAEYEIFIPSNLAYGERGTPGIPPNSTLIFNVTLLDIKPGPELPTLPPGAPGGASKPVTSDIIKVPSAEELKKGAKIEVLKPEDVEREIAKEKARKEAEAKKNEGK